MTLIKVINSFWKFLCSVGVSHKRLFNIFILSLVGLFCKTDIMAQPAKLYLNADSQQYNYKTKKVVLTNGIIVSMATFITADHIEYSQNQNFITAKGHIVIINKSQLFTGSKLLYDNTTKNFSLTNAKMITNDSKYINKIINRLLGITHTELEFEKNRAKQLAILNNRLEKFSKKGVKTNLYKQQHELIQKQLPPNLAILNKAKRAKTLERRNFWKKNQIKTSLTKAGSYYKITADKIIKLNKKTFAARSSFLTICKCDDDSLPAWDFSSKKMTLNQGGYANLDHAVLRIRGIPILYFPYFKIPIKNSRQSGLLMPTISYESSSGSIYSQSLFINFAKNFDLTLTPTYFENRGTRLSTKLRYESSSNSGWQVKAETIHDRLWAKEINLLSEVNNLYKSSLSIAEKKTLDGKYLPDDKNISARSYTRKILEDPDYWKEVLELEELGNKIDPVNAFIMRDTIEQSLQVNQSAWRSNYSWSGKSFLTPRVSFVSKGQIITDHRYTNELEIPNSIESLFSEDADTSPIKKSELQFNLDAEMFYLGIGAHYGDNGLSNYHYNGEQIPARVKIQSTTFSLLPSSWNFQLYADLNAEVYKFQDEKFHLGLKKSLQTEEQTSSQVQSLGDGVWKKAKLNITSPLFSNYFLTLSNQTEFEARYITNSVLKSKFNEIRSWRTNFDFVVPIDGRSNSNNESKLVHHLMRYKFGLSLRPVVIRKGEYATRDQISSTLLKTYFESDNYYSSASDSNISLFAKMQPHKILHFSIDQNWNIEKKIEKKTNQVTYKTTSKPVQLNTKISYDILKAEKREEAKVQNQNTKEKLFPEYDLKIVVLTSQLKELNTDSEKNKTKIDEIKKEINKLNNEKKLLLVSLPKPWLGPSSTLKLSYNSWSLSTTLDWSVYSHNFKKLLIHLSPPRFLSTSLQLSYRIENSTDLIRTQTAAITNNYYKPLGTFYKIERNLKDNTKESYSKNYKVSYGFNYVSDSDCWGLSFLKTKNFNSSQAEAVYLLKLSIIFAGKSRYLPDLSPILTKNI